MATALPKTPEQMLIEKEAALIKIRKDLDITMPQKDASRFLVDTINQASTLPKLVPVFRSVGTGNIDALTVDSRKIREAGVNDTADGTGSVSSRKIPFVVKKVKWDEWIQNDDVWYAQAARGEDIETTIIDMIQKQFGVDLQDLAFNGDTDAESTPGVADPFLSILDGFVKTMKTSPHVTDLVDNEPTILDFINHIQKLPEKYKSEAMNVNWFINRAIHDKLVAAAVTRQTGFSDVTLVDGQIKRLGGYPVEIVAEQQSGFAALTPLENLKPVFTQDLKYIRTASGATAAAKDATYHVFFAYLDCIVREIDAVAYMKGSKL